MPASLRTSIKSASMSEFQTKFLHEVTSMISGFAFKSKHMGVGKSRVVKIKNVVEPHVLVDQCDVLDETQYPAEKIAKFRLIEGDVLISMTGYLGRVATMPPIRETYFLNQRVAKLVPYEARDLAFIKFQLQNEAFKDHCEAFTDSATAQPNISVKSMSQFEIEWPSFENRQAIAEVLSSLDDKIDLLKRQNKTLEGMAEALFRQWFIEEAQDDWEEISIYDTCAVTYGFPFKSKQFNNDKLGTPILRIRDLRNGVCGVSSLEACEDKYIIDKGDLVAGMDGEFRLYQWSGSRCHLNQRVCKFAPNQTFGAFFCYFSIGNALQYFEKVKVGTTVIHLGKGDIDSIAFKVPSRFRVEEFNCQTRPYWSRINSNNELISNLSLQRDTLLPKLMSGEVRVNLD